MKLTMFVILITLFDIKAHASEYPVKDEMQDKQYQVQFFTKVCGLSNPKKASKKQKAECDTKYLETFLARLQIQYPEAKEDANVWCKANPMDCPSDWEKVEEHFEELQVHAEYLEGKHASQRQAEIDHQDQLIGEQRDELRQQQESAEENSERQSRVQMAAAIMNRPIYQAPIYQAPIYRPVNCMTNRIGNTAFTNCN